MAARKASRIGQAIRKRVLASLSEPPRLYQ